MNPDAIYPLHLCAPAVHYSAYKTPGVLVRHTQRKTEREQQAILETEAETGVLQPQVKKCLQPPAPSRLANTLVLDFWSPKTIKRTNFCCFKPCNLWKFPMADTGN